jgi:hypothetical protein
MDTAEIPSYEPPQRQDWRDREPVQLPAAQPRPSVAQWTAKDLEELAFQLALQYHPPEELCVSFGITEPVLNVLQRTPEFARKVQAYQQKIADDGTAFKLKARHILDVLLDELPAIALDQHEDAKNRLKAVDMIAEFADRKPKRDDSDGGVKLVINTNLTLNTAPEDMKSYVIEAPTRLLDGAGPEG